ncbi:MAG: OmpA family protein [Steroidobacterales bacterium]
MTGIARADEPASVSSPPVLPGRPIGSRVGEPSAVRQLQDRLDVLNAAGGSGDCDVQYQSHKAQAWLNFARYAVQNDVPAPVRSAALHNAGDIVNGLERHTAAPVQTVELPQSRRVRDDLWRAVKAVKSDGRWCAAPKMTAYCEVQLAWVGYEAGAGGWRHVDPYVRIAEDYCVTASNAIPPPAATRVADAAPKAAELGPPDVADALARPADAPATADIASKLPPIMPAEHAVKPIDASIYVLFPHDRARRTDIRPPGRRTLRHFAEHFRTLSKDTVVMVVGHADITGRPGYNMKLSARRARSVALELTMWGVDPARIHVSAAGDSKPVVACARNSRTRRGKRRYLACLEPNRRVVVQLQGETQ